MHNTFIYEVEYPDVTTEQLAVKIIAEICYLKLTLKVNTIKYSLK